MKWEQPASLRYVYNYKLQLKRVATAEEPGPFETFELDLGGTALQPILEEKPFIRIIDSSVYANISSG